MHGISLVAVLLNMSHFIQRPALLLFLAALVGTLAGTQLSSSWLWPTHILAIVLLLGAWLSRRTSWGTMLLLLGAGLVYASLAMSAKQISSTDISHWGARRDITLTGRLTQGPKAAHRPGYWQGVLTCTQAQWHGTEYPVSGRVRFRASGEQPDWQQGDELRLTGKLQPWDQPANPAEFNLAEHYTRQGLGASLRVYSPAMIARVERGRWFSWAALTGQCQQWLTAGLRAACPKKQYGWVAAVVLADRSGLTSWDKAVLANAGLSHLLALSGLHAGIIFSLAFGSIRLLRGAVRPALLGGLAMTTGYTVVMGAQIPLVRATLMLTGVVAANLAGRKSDPLSGLSCAGMLLLAIRPLAVLSAGFQLSFSATAAILITWPAVETISRKFPRLLRGPLRMFLISAIIVIGTAPLTVFHFYSVTPAAILANLAAVPLLFCILTTGLLAAIVTHLCLPAGVVLAWVSAQAAGWLRALASGTIAFPGPGLYLWAPPAWWVAGCLILLLAASLKVRARTLWIACAWAWCLLLLLFRPDPLFPDETRVTFLALGIGEAALVETGAGSRWLFDCGTEQEFLWRVKPYLASRGIRRLSGLVLSHLDKDHAGGVRACLALFRVSRVFTASDYASLVHVLGPDPSGTGVLPRQYTFMERGKTWRQLQDESLHALWPPPGGRSGRNHECLVIHMRTLAGNLLFPGDSPARVERQWQLPGTCRILKAGHHGDQDASSRGLLVQCQPEMVVITPGTRNSYGLPDPETLHRLRRNAAVVLNTKTDGAVQVRMRPGRPPRWQAWQASP